MTNPAAEVAHSPAAGAGGSPQPGKRPPLTLFPTTLWDYPSQHYDPATTPGVLPARASRRVYEQGSKDYAGATPSWILWQLLTRYTLPGDTVLDPMCGSGTTIDVARDLGRTPLAFDLAPQRPEIKRADARALPLHDAAADFTFIDPPYSKHIDYSDDTRCIGKLDAAALADADDQPNPYFTAMADVIAEIDRTLRPGRFMALYVSDSFTKTGAASLGDRAAPGAFSPIGFQLFSILAFHFQPIDIIAVVRHNQKLERGHWRQAAEKGNFFLRGFNYLFILRKPDATPRARRPARR